MVRYEDLQSTKILFPTMRPEKEQKNGSKKKKNNKK